MFYTKRVILKKLFISVLFLAFLFLSQVSVRAECITGQNGWVVCVNPDGSQTRATTCEQLSGIGTETCGAGSGCGPTGCYNCASQGNCQGGGSTPSGNNCPPGRAWNDCASGNNTCVPGEKWSDCKTGSDTRVYGQEPNCSESCTDQGVWADCTANEQTTQCYKEDCFEYNCGWRQQCTDTNCGWRDRWVRNEGWEQYWGCDQYCSGDYWACDRYCYNGRMETCGGGCISWGSPYMHRDCNRSCNGTRTVVVSGSNTCAGGYSWDNCANGGTNSCQGGCVNLPCNSVAPSTPGLTSPVSGAEVSGTETNLAGATASWGTACSGQNYQFNIYVQQCDAIMNPTTLWKTVTASGNNFNELFAGVGGKGYCWTAEATNGVTTSAKATAQRWTFVGGMSWWQVSGGSVMTFGGVTSLVGKNQKFITDAPGVVISGAGNVFLNGQDANANKWVVTDGLLSQKVSYRYDYDYVSGRIISTIKPVEVGGSVTVTDNLKPAGALVNGVYYVQVTGNLDIVGDLNFGSDRVVVLVTGDANIKGKINFTKNQGLFALYAKGNINIDPSIGTVSGAGINPNGLPTHLEGLYLAQGAINTGAAASQLRLEGAFIGIGGVNLQRKLNSVWPSEYFVFRPDILINLPKQLLRQNHIWQELAP